MSFFGSMAIFVGIGILLRTGVCRGTSYYIYYFCYYEGGICGTKQMSCNDSLVIAIEWSRIGHSDYWSSDGSYTNCSVTDSSCYEDVTEPITNCSGLQSCSLHTCSNITHKQFFCGGNNQVSNFLRINYTCVAANSSLTVRTESVSTSGLSKSINRQNTSPATGSADVRNTSRRENNEEMANETRKSSKVTTGVTITVLAVIIITIVIIFVIRRRNKECKRSREDSIQATHTEPRIKDEPDKTNIEKTNCTTVDGVTETKTASGLSALNDKESSLKIDNDNYENVDLGSGDHRTASGLPTLNDKESSIKIDNDNYETLDLGSGDHRTASGLPTLNDKESSIQINNDNYETLDLGSGLRRKVNL